MDVTLPSPPFVDVPGIANFRGIGGQNVGPGLVFRSADPSKATRAGLEKMSQDLGKVSLTSRRAFGREGNCPSDRRQVSASSLIFVPPPRSSETVQNGPA